MRPTFGVEGRVRGRTCGSASLVALLLLLGACRAEGPAPGPSPTPTPATSPSVAPTSATGPRVAVVLPAGPAERSAALRQDVGSLGERLDDELASLRIVQPDEPAFVADVTDLVADRGADLVCVLGQGAGAVVLSVAARFPGTRFCAAPAASAPATEIPANVLLVDVRVEEIAFLAGVAAHLVDPSSAPGFVAGESQHAVDRQRAAFVAGLNSVSVEPRTPYFGFPAGDAERAFALASSHYEAGATAIYATAGTSDPGVLRAAEANGGLVVGSRRTLLADTEAPEAADLPAEVLMTTDLDLTPALELAVRRMLGTWEGGTASVGLSDGALAVGPGGSPRFRAVAARLEAVRTRIESGDLLPLPPP